MVIYECWRDELGGKGRRREIPDQLMAARMRKSVFGCLLLCFTVRAVLVLLFPGLGNAVDHSVQFSTPVTSFRSLQEGVFLLRHGLPVYDGGVVHLPPLLLHLCRFINGKWLFVAIDCAIVWVLHGIETGLQETAIRCAWIYCINPLTVLSCVSGSTIGFTYLCLLSSVYFILIKRDFTLSALHLALATYLDPVCGVLLLPLINFITSPRLIKKISIFIMTFIVCGVCLYHLCPFPMSIVYGTRISFNSVVPNMGLWWYFFVEMFQEFIPFFKSVFNLYSMGMIIPITLRFYGRVHPLHCFILSMGWLILTKPYPTLGETGVFISLLPLFDLKGVSILKYMKYPMFTALLFIHGVLLSPIFYHLWIDLGSGNSNFFYAISLVYGLAMGLLITDIMWGVIRLEYDGGKPNYTRKLTQV